MSGSATLLVELLCEELPPKALRMLGDEFANLVTNGLVRAGIAATQPPAVHATPRRLALQLLSIPARAEDRAVDVKLMPMSDEDIAVSDQDVEAVIRKVLLQKKPSSLSEMRGFLEKHGGEVSRQLHGTRIGETAQDRDVIVDDYPLLPVRRRFWEHCFRAVDAAGTHSQLRSQLRIIHDAVARISDRHLGATVP